MQQILSPAATAESYTTRPSAQPHISIVIPAYRSAPWLKDLIGNISGMLGGMGKPCEIILVADYSPDNNGQVIKGYD